MRIISVAPLRECWNIHREAEGPLRSWYEMVDRAQWQTSSDVLATFNKADIIPDNRVVFNIFWNRYRIVVKIHYNTGLVFVRFVGTHAEYNRIDAETV